MEVKYDMPGMANIKEIYTDYQQLHMQCLASQDPSVFDSVQKVVQPCASIDKESFVEILCHIK